MNSGSDACGPLDSRRDRHGRIRDRLAMYYGAGCPRLSFSGPAISRLTKDDYYEYL